MSLPLKKTAKSNEEEEYPDDFESYDSEESISLHDPNESLELVVTKTNKISNENHQKNVLTPSKTPILFEIEKNFEILTKSSNKKHKQTMNSIDFYCPSFGGLDETTLLTFHEKNKIIKKNSSESHRSVPFSCFNYHRDGSPSSTEFSYNTTKMSCSFLRPTLCDQSILFTKCNHPPQLTATSWAILNESTGQIITGRNLNKRKEIASLTKIMTSYVVCQLLKRMAICPYTTFLQVSKKASLYQGTSADLLEGDQLSIFDVLHALMLPSGNDAACCLAENFGVYLYYEKFARKNNKKKLMLPKKGCMSYFIDEMNEIAKKLKLKQTFFACVHGLPNEFNKSTAFDLCKLSASAMKEELIANIVCKKSHTVFIRNSAGTSREIQWENLNKILNIPGFIGLKTGVTAPAGACLSSVYRDEAFSLIFVVLGCQSKEERFSDTEILLNWVKVKLMSNNCFKEKLLLGEK